MSENNPWADQWFKAQQQFVDAWSDMAKSGGAGDGTSQSDLWSQGFDMWRRATEGRAQPDMELVMRKCMDMTKEYFSMAEQVSKSLSEGANPVEAVNQWLEQVKLSLQKFSGMPGFNGAGVADFMKQWFTPNASWQEMVAELTPMNQAFWQMPGMNTSVFNLGEAIDPLGRVLEAPGIGYFREPQEKQQRGIQLALEYQEANFKFNQAFLRVAIESIQGFQQRLLQLDEETTPKTMRALYDLWVEISEQHYAEFAMSEEYQSLYGDMVNRLMTMRKHYSEMADDFLRALNLPNTREIDTMQERLQQVRRDNYALKKEIREIRALLARPGAKPAALSATSPAQSKSTQRKPATVNKAAPKAVTPKAPAKKTAAGKTVARKTAARKAKVTRSTAGA
ncbi:MAG: class III poly(R)-hydroxyalkanoic acid synthase subunit PhaE [Gammaproteobacteria bacterium]|nr:class III poly(R)-hydroxyalkanoic acid synthase subunit PhaE [Gammaproteobacteria bacterium]MDH3450380.1 class III poly(R)-hydroxyalkanoic acid synthase subunit PhaE [Gammaproteobacteria bacterium]